jgi:DNA-directed RNA polymerase specialized sigma24 family protein
VAGDRPAEDEAFQEGATETAAILQCFERIYRISRLDLKRFVDKLSGKQQAYLQLIVESGPISYSKAAQELEVSVDQVTSLCSDVAERLGSLLRELSET